MAKRRAFWKDDPVVYLVDRNLDRALRILKNRIANLKLFSTLRDRSQNPKASDRRRAKKRRALHRKIKKERLFRK